MPAAPAEVLVRHYATPRQAPWISSAPHGRPTVSTDVRTLIREASNANPRIWSRLRDETRQLRETFARIEWLRTTGLEMEETEASSRLMAR